MGTLTDEWMSQTLSEALTFGEKTGPVGDIQRALAAHALLCPAKGRAGRPTSPIQLGGPIVCVDYSSQSLSIGNLFRTGIDFGGATHVGGETPYCSI